MDLPPDQPTNKKTLQYRRKWKRIARAKNADKQQCRTKAFFDTDQDKPAPIKRIR